MSGAQRYIDLDLRIDPSLIGLAIEYASQYVGEWDVMLAARDQALTTGTLPIGVARTVLNCARADPRFDQQRLPAGRSGAFVGALPDDVPSGVYEVSGPYDDPPSVRVTPKASERPRRGHLRAVPDEPELFWGASGRREPWRRSFMLPTTWHWRYGVSTHKAAKVWHVLDVTRSSIEYWPTSDVRATAGRFVPRMAWVCSSWAGAGSDHLRLFPTPPDGPMCRTCERRLEDPNLRVSAALAEWWAGEQERWAE